jgi:foldase protein PrsA
MKTLRLHGQGFIIGCSEIFRKKEEENMKLKRLSVLALAGVIAGSAVLTGCGSLDPEATVATVNGTPISLGLANCLAQYTAVDYDTYYMTYFGDDMWSSDPNGDGSTMTDVVKDNALDQLEEYYLLEQHMTEYGVEITSEELDEIGTAAAQFISDNTKEALDALGATEDIVKEMLRLSKIQKKMRDAIVADIDRDVPDEECAQKTFSYVRVKKTSSSTDDEAEELSEEEQAAQAKETAQKILDEALLGSTDDPLETAAEDNDANKSTCSFGASDLNEDDNSTYLELEVLEAADKLEDGEYAADLIETDSYYYVIRLDSSFDEDATERERESIISDRESDRYDEVVQGYKDEAEWSIDEKVWEPVNFDTIYSKVQSSSEDTESADTEGSDTDSEAETETDTESADTNVETETK